MAALDKTYVTKWEDYREIREWANKTTIIYPNGLKGDKMIKWFYFPNLSESDFKGKEIPLWNTTESEDYFLLHNCPFKLVQDRLKEQYGEALEEMKECKPINLHEEGNFFIVPKEFKCNKLYDIELTRNDEYWFYSEYHDWWSEYRELGPWNTNCCTKKFSSQPDLYNQVNKWKLPKGMILTFTNNSNFFKIKIK